MLMTAPFLDSFRITWAVQRSRAALPYRERIYTYASLEAACRQAAGWLQRWKRYWVGHTASATV